MTRHARVVLIEIAAALSLAAPAFGLASGELLDEISVERLRTHVAALEGPRWSNEAKAVAAAYISAELENYGYTVSRQPALTSDNLIVRISGSVAPEYTFVVGAHYDTVLGSPGADDNASGVAALLEIARALRDQQPATSIELVAFADEEINLAGSWAYATQAGSALRKLTGMLSLEMIGYACNEPGCQFPVPNVRNCLELSDATANVGNFIAAVANRSSADLLDTFIDAAAAAAPGLPLIWGLVRGAGTCFPDTRRSDHSPFWDAGYAAMLITDTANFRNPNYHGPGDAAASLDFEFATQVTRSALATTLAVAAVVPMPTMPPTIERTPQPTPTPLPTGAPVELYLGGSAGVTVVQMGQRIATRAIPIPWVWDVVITSDQRTAYIAAGFLAVDDAPPQIAVYDIDSRAIVNRLSLEREPYALALSADGSDLYVTTRGAPGRLLIVDTASLEEVETVELSSETGTAATITSDGRFAFVGGLTLQEIDLDTLHVTRPVELASDARAITMTPDGKTLYVSVQNAHRVSVIDVATRSHIADIPMSYPGEIVIDAEGTTAYARSSGDAGAFLVSIDTRRNLARSTMPIPGTYGGIELLPQTSELFFHFGGGILVVDPRAMTMQSIRLYLAGDALHALGVRLPTRTPTPRPTFTMTPTLRLTPLAPCPGDCDHDRQVGVDELTLLVGAALGEIPASACPDADLDANERVTVDEITAAVARALGGCELAL